MKGRKIRTRIQENNKRKDNYYSKMERKRNQVNEGNEGDKADFKKRRNET